MTSCSSAGALPALRPASRRRRRVLYPPSRCRRWTPREDPDRALRWVRLLAALLFVQIFSEDSGPDAAGAEADQGERPTTCEHDLTRESPPAARPPAAPSEPPVDPLLG